MARQMKDSGVEWIGQIPEEWDVARLCDIKSEKKFAIVDGPFGSAISTNDYREKGVPLIRISNLKNGEVSDEDMVYISEELAESVRRSCIGLSDIVFAKTGATIGKCGINRLIKYGILASSCIKISISHKYNCDYFCYIFSTDQFNQALRNTCTGTTRDTINLTPFSKLNVLLPPYCIQNRIASYLDRKCAEIDAIIAKQQQIIEKLKEYKLSVITEAVTKGLDPNVPMKDSGVEWIGMVPERWKVGQLKYFATIRAGLTLGKKYEIDAKLVEMPYLRVANVQGEYVDLSDVSSVSVLPEEVEKYSLHKNELLMTEGGDKDKLGRGCVWNGEIDPCLHQNHVFAVATDAKKLSIHFLSYLTTSGVARSYFEYTAKKTTNLASTNSTIILQFKLPIPSIQEQGDIICYLDKCCKQINTLIHEKENILSKINEYKKALIYEVVTGKKEVL